MDNNFCNHLHTVGKKGDSLACFHISHAIKLYFLICLQKCTVLFPPLSAWFLAQIKPQ